MKIVFAKAFKKRYLKLLPNSNLEKRFWEYTAIFENNPFDNRLNTHKLSAKLKNYYSFSIGYDLRVIFTFSGDNSEAVFLSIGNHDSVY